MRISVKCQLRGQALRHLCMQALFAVLARRGLVVFIFTASVDGLPRLRGTVANNPGVAPRPSVSFSACHLSRRGLNTFYRTHACAVFLVVLLSSLHRTRYTGREPSSVYGLTIAGCVLCSFNSVPSRISHERGSHSIADILVSHSGDLLRQHRKAS